MTQPAPLIAHVLHRLDRAGAEVLAADLARQLTGRYRFAFFCLDEVGSLGLELRDQGFPVVAVRRSPGLDLRVAARLRAGAREHGVALWHAHQYTPFFYAALSRGPGPRPPLLFTEHGRHYPDLRRVRRVLANRLLLRRGDRVTAVGHFVRHTLIENEGIPRSRVEVIHNGIDPDRFVPADPAEARAQLGLGPEQRVVMQVARFHPVKDHATGIEAFARAVDAAPDAVLVLVGDGEARPAAEALASRLGRGERVRFLGVRSGVEGLLPAADVFMLSSLSEGISVTLLEAMACRVPIVATDVGGNREVVEHGRNGLLSQRGDAQGLGHNLAMLLRDAKMRRDMGEAGRNRLLKHFSQSRMHQGYEALYGQMLG